MFRILLLIVVAVLVGIALAPQIVPAATWILAFFSLLMLGDLLYGAVRKMRGRPRG